MSKAKRTRRKIAHGFNRGYEYVSHGENKAHRFNLGLSMSNAKRTRRKIAHGFSRGSSII